MKTTILILGVLLSTVSVAFAQIVTNEGFRCETKSLADFEDGIETRQFKQLWKLLNNDFFHVSALMKYLQIADFYDLKYMHPKGLDSMNWVQNYSVQRPIIGEYSYVFKRISSHKARNYYDFEFLLKGDSVFAVRLDNNCKNFTRYDKTRYCELVKEYSKIYHIKSRKYCRDFSFFTNYSFGPMYGMQGQQINPLFNKLIMAVNRKDIDQLNIWLNAIEPELKATGILGYIYIRRLHNYKPNKDELEIIGKATKGITILKTSFLTNFYNKSDFFNEIYLDDTYYKFFVDN